LFQQHQTLSRTAATTNFGFGQKGAIVKITAISGFATCDVNGLTAAALRAHASIHQIPTGCWAFPLVHHGGENACSGSAQLGRFRTAKLKQAFECAAMHNACDTRFVPSLRNLCYYLELLRAERVTERRSCSPKRSPSEKRRRRCP